MKSIFQLIENKKIETDEDQDKIDFIKDLIKQENWMFLYPVDMILTILDYLGVKENELEVYYSELISSKNLKK